MNLKINEKLIKRNKKIGNILSITGIAVLAVGLILNLNPTATKTIISFGALIVGFIISQISTYYVTRFGRSPRSDELITDNLNKLNNDYTFYVYDSPVPMLLVGPTGIWIPIPISAGGEIYFDKKWKQRGGAFMLKLFGTENIGKPEMEVRDNEAEIKKALSTHFEEDQMPPINSILVAIHPNATIGDVENAPVPIAKVDALRRKIRMFDRKVEEKFPPEMVEKINEIF